MSSLLPSVASMFLNGRQILTPGSAANLICIRYKAKKAGGSTRNSPDTRRPKHRGWRVQDGTFVRAGTILATQLKTRFHPGLYVGIGRDKTLYATEAGKVMVTCEKIDPDFNLKWVRDNYGNREGVVIYKKHFNVIPEPQHDRFKLIDAI
ncbi:hypothetical protein KM043_002449 [Ampulex compressa]|nr:hypothetical protein KM043_002449 [Ampulex compressa]